MLSMAKRKGVTMPQMIMKHDVDPKQALIDGVGDISDLQIFNNKLLVAVYIRPQQTKSGIFLTDQVRDEDRYQGKVGLILKMGPSAFIDPSEHWFKGADFKLHDWVIFRPSDGWAITINGVLCRVLTDIDVQLQAPNCDMAW